jgi:predicted lipid-binding transport protein (Tim44 family)
VIVEIIILAMVAAFLGLRLYSVLGRRAEHNEEPIQGPLHRPESLPGRALPPRPEERAALPRANNPVRPEAGFDPVAEPGIRAIVAADRRFDIAAFREGAKGAYGMILEAFWRGDKDELRQLCDHDVFESFAAAIDARAAAGETLENRLIRIEEATVVGASFDAPIARITMRFAADIASVTRDGQGNVVAGSLDDAIVSRDIWTFKRDVTSRDPDWLLDETDEG